MKHISTSLTKTFLVILICLSFNALYAQNEFKTKQVIIASSGTFGNPNNYVHVGSYDPATKVYTVFDSIRTTSTKNILIDGKYAYITGDTVLVKYDIDNYTRLASGKTSGLNSPGGYLASYKDYILTTRGYGANDNFVIAYNKSDLSEAFTISGIPQQTAGIVVVGDSAYVAEQGSFGYDSGRIAVIDLKNRQLKHEIMLDTLGAGINKLFTDGVNIYAQSSKRSVISTLNIASGALSHKVGYTNSTSGNAIALNKGILYTDFGNVDLGSYNLTSGSVTNAKIIEYKNIPGVTSQYSLGGMALDTVLQQFYITVSDYFSYGNAYVFDINGNAVDTFAVGISPEAIAVDYRSTVGIKETNNKILAINAYPNPAKNALTISTQGLTNAVITITDISGKTLFTQSAENQNTQLNIQHFPAGMYIINLKADEGFGVQKFIKQ